MGELLKQYADKSVQPSDFRLTIDGKYLKADPAVSKGAPVFVGASDAMIERYFMQLGGTDVMRTPKSAMIGDQQSDTYTITRADGVKINLRRGSSSAATTGARWTIDIINTLGRKARLSEVKFK